ncbi:MAG: aldo/keto reductase [Spirochaetales bacterium]|jgi:myo-inositol catabolism protein IolS|nr:aldo/keto reductase [Spirochaetales bacterium]
MKYRTLGSTDIDVSVIGVGTWQFGGEWGQDYTEAEADSIIKTAKDAGINLIDTAECYGDHLSERLVGKSISAERDSWIVATKFGHKFLDFMERDQTWAPEAVLKQLEDSLLSLQTDYIDLYQFHSGVDEFFDTDGLWEMLQKQVEAGKIRHLGISIGSNANIRQTRAATDVGAEAIQVVYNRLDRAPEDEVLPACRELNLGVLARVPLASGFLSGKYKPGAQFTGNDVRAKREQEGIDAKLREVEEIQRTEVPEGVSMAAWALAWCLKNDAVTTVIPGCKSPEQVKMNAQAADLI